VDGQRFDREASESLWIGSAPVPVSDLRHTLPGQAALSPPPVDLGPRSRYRLPGVQAGGSSMKLYDFGILIIAALVASVIAAAILTQVHH
jgi:hypothetical protein